MYQLIPVPVLLLPVSLLLHHSNWFLHSVLLLLVLRIHIHIRLWWYNQNLQVYILLAGILSGLPYLHTMYQLIPVPALLLPVFQLLHHNNWFSHPVFLRQVLSLPRHIQNKNPVSLHLLPNRYLLPIHILLEDIFSQFLPAILHMYLSDHHPNDNPPLFHC